MHSRPPRRLLGLVAILVLAALPARAPTTAGARRGTQFGVLTTGHGADIDAVMAGIHAGFRLADLEPDVLEKSAAGDESVARATAMEFAFEGVDVVFALGPDAARVARDALRERSVVFAGVGYPEALGLPGRGNVCGVAGGVGAEAIVECVRRVAPSARCLGVLAGSGDEDGYIARRVEAVAADGGLETVRLVPVRTEAGADEIPQAAECDAIWIAAGIEERRVETLARGLEGSRVALVGSRRGHLPAGCSVVLRTDAHEQGLHAAALARRVLDGEAPEELGVRHIHRVRLEINLDAARRLDHEIPLPVLAAADHLAPAFGRRR